MEKQTSQKKDLKDKKIKRLEDQVKMLQEKHLQAQKDNLFLNTAIDDIKKQLIFYRACIEKGIDVREMFLAEIPQQLSRAYDIKMYLSVRDNFKSKWNPLFNYFLSKKINKIVKILNETMCDYEKI